MKTTQILQSAAEHLESAKELMREAKTNESLSDYYGYTIELMVQDIDRIINTQTRQSGIDEIISTCGDEWYDHTHDDVD